MREKLHNPFFEYSAFVKKLTETQSEEIYKYVRYIFLT